MSIIYLSSDSKSTHAPRYSESRLRVGLGTFIAIDAHAISPRVAAHAIDAAYAAINRVEFLMHPTQPGSDLAALRAQAPGVPLQVHPWTWQVIALSHQLKRRSDGAFDPCLPGAGGRLHDVTLTAGGRVVLREPVQLDLGGIAKGFAVDRAIDALRSAGCDRGLVNAGGDLAVFGARTHVIECRADGGRSTTVTLRNAALATSHALALDSTAPGSQPAEHRGHYHGSTGKPVRPGSATISAPCAAVADALTKCVLAAGRAQLNGRAQRELLDAFDARLITF